MVDDPEGAPPAGAERKGAPTTRRRVLSEHIARPELHRPVRYGWWAQRILGFLLPLVAVLAAVGGQLEWTGAPPAAQIALAILVTAATLWITEVVPLHVTSFVILALCLVWLAPAVAPELAEEEGLAEKAAEKVLRGRFMSPFFSNIILLFLGGFAVSSALRKYHLDEDLALSILAKTRGSVTGILLSLMGLTAFLSMWLSNTATAAMMMSLAIPIVNRLPEKDRQRNALLLAIPFAANLGGLGTPIGSPPNAIAISYMRKAGLAPSFLEWMLMGIPMVIVLLLLLFVALKFFFRGATRSVEYQEVAPRPARKFWKVSVVIATSVVTVLLWLTTSWHGLASGTVALLPLIALFGTGVLHSRDLRNLPWDVLLMMGGGLCLGVAMSQSHLDAWIVGSMPLPGGEMMLVLVFGGLALVMSTLMSNTATANLVVPVVLGLSIAGKAPMLATVGMSCSLAMALPISTPPNAIAYGTGRLKIGQLAGLGALISLVGFAVLITVGRWAWGWMGLI